MATSKKLFRSSTNKVIAGVCGGIGEYFDIDPTIVRIVWALCIVIGGMGVLAYLIMWIIMSKQR